MPFALPAPSYLGRHRTPSAPHRSARLIAGLTTAGAVAAAPVVLAGPAQAASGGTWDRLASCESGGNWHISTGNGYYGGLQFSSSTWRAFGGGHYASTADRASRGEQIVIAEHVLDAQGWGAWPSCSHRLGLTRADAAGSPSVSRSERRTAIKANRHHAVRHTTQHTYRQYKAHRKHAAYVVRSGDSLSAIAGRQQVRGGWHALYAANRHAIGADPNRIRVGQHLAIPR